jgi:hypothetical protein
MEFEFYPRWKEELVVKGDGGSFVLEMPIGVLSVYLPTEDQWSDKSPCWAKGDWSLLRSQLEIWCKENKAQFHLDETAGVFDITNDS